jgi:hypothetical protein
VLLQRRGEPAELLERDPWRIEVGTRNLMLRVSIAATDGRAALVRLNIDLGAKASVAFTSCRSGLAE